METVVERPAALDVHKEQVTACVRVPGQDGSREQHVEEFATTVAGLLTLSDWLAAFGVTQVVMEATGVFWRPVWAILEDGFECVLVNARHVKQVPGRKTDVKDAEWLCQLAEAGLLRGSFVPPKPIRALRNLTRYRKTQIQERAREANRLHKALEDTGIKLDCVASDILGKSGRAMLDALVNGTRDPEVLAELARGRMRAKIPARSDALKWLHCDGLNWPHLVSDERLTVRGSSSSSGRRQREWDPGWSSSSRSEGIVIVRVSRCGRSRSDMGFIAGR
jgi:transposase